MPYKANEPRRHKIPRARYRVANWPEYDRALQQRGSLTVWVTPEALAAWHPPRTGQRGRPRSYSDVAIETGHLLRLAFGRPWRQTEGLLRSLTTLLGVRAGVPDHTTFSRRSPGLAPYHRSNFHVAQSGGGTMRRCKQKRRRRRPRVNRDIRLRATFLGCVPAVFFQQGFGSRRHPTCRLTPPSRAPRTAPARAGPAGRCA